jgi:regulator of sigma E protease
MYFPADGDSKSSAGGHLLYYLVELITGKPVSDGVQQVGMRIGMALVGGLMFLAIFNDIARL